MAEETTTDRPPNPKGIIYAVDQEPPTAVLVSSVAQHVLLLLSLGVALPVTVSRVIGLSQQESTTFLCISLFCIGLSTILQSCSSKLLGCGYQSYAEADSSAISTCVVAAQAGGMPLLFGMTLFAGVLHFSFSFFATRLRRVFTPDVTGCMIFILGISLIPQTCENVLSYASFKETGVFNATAVGISVVTFLAMLCCSIFWKSLKQYAVLVGMVFGYVLSLAFGVLDIASIFSLGSVPLLVIPVPTSIRFSFDWMMAFPFAAITAASLIDNIGDISSAQAANNGPHSKPSWKLIENGIRACGLAQVLSGFLGGSMMSTSTSSTGISKASGITSVKVAFVSGIALIVLAFFPRVVGVLTIIPEPVLGAVLMFATCYTMADGFEMLTECDLDDRRIFLIFVSIVLATSTLVPDLYSFLPQNVSDVLISPVVVGSITVVFMKLVVSLGNRKRFKFSYDAVNDEIADLNAHIEDVCRNRAVPKSFASKLRIGIDALCEAFEEDNPKAVVEFSVSYDEGRIKAIVEADNIDQRKGLHAHSEEDEYTAFSVTMLMLANMFDRVDWKLQEGVCRVTIESEAE